MNETDNSTTGRIDGMSIAPYSGDPGATQGKRTEWEVIDGDRRVTIKFDAFDREEEFYTSIAKGHLSREQARELYDALGDVLDQ